MNTEDIVETGIAGEGVSPENGESMESLLAQQAAVADKLASKKVAWVKVIQVTKDQVLVDIGQKREGVVPLSEFVTQPDPKKPAEGKAPAIGQRIPVLLQVADREGVTRLSYRKARAELGWDAAVKAHAEKQRVRGSVVQAIKGGFLVELNGIKGFLPASLADLRPVRQSEKMVGTGVRCYIIELNESKKQVVLSRKAVLEEEAGKRREQLLGELRVGEVRIGRVVHTGPAGVVVDIGGAEGLVKPADVAWGAPKGAGPQRGDKVRVKILSKPAAGASEPVALGIKQLLPNPADALRKKYPPKTVVHGKVLEAGPAGVRFELEDKKVAVCAAAETDPDQPLKPGDPVSAIVLGVHPESFELTASIAKFSEIKDRKRLAQYLKAPPPLTLGQLLSPDKE